MIEFGKYAVPVLAAWGISLALLGGLVVQTLVAGRRARLALDEAERRSGNHMTNERRDG